ncbi:hypothetical protein GGS23DRAFT_598860 [Durotheca rogersii]|uniref:uncharacterized protein n=1 Tax=Durotheca rogersii TaxID=419775 RepID=UPI002220AA11|nr:uncharacterized protein GGS23DRAFT_598860 [Durotheca rogersii]KAI5860975.1 hypothetical protein GGS23DRAFT_598860 [Durotheca rogersii]
MPEIDQDLRSALIRTNLFLLQREIREKNHWYTSRRVVVRKRNGRIHLSRLGSQSHGHSDDDESSQGAFTFVDEPPSTRSSRTNSSSSSGSSSTFDSSRL